MFRPRYTRRSNGLWLPVCGAGPWRFNPCEHCCDAATCPYCGGSVPSTVQITFQGVTQEVCSEEKCDGYWNDVPFILDVGSWDNPPFQAKAGPVCQYKFIENGAFADCSEWGFGMGPRSVAISFLWGMSGADYIYTVGVYQSLYLAQEPIQVAEFIENIGEAKPDCEITDPIAITLDSFLACSAGGQFCCWSNATCTLDTTP